MGIGWAYRTSLENRENLQMRGIKWKLIQVKVNNTKGLGKKTNPVEN